MRGRDTSPEITVLDSCPLETLLMGRSLLYGAKSKCLELTGTRICLVFSLSSNASVVFHTCAEKF